MTNSETMAADRTPFHQGYKHPGHRLLYLVVILIMIDIIMIDINDKNLYS